DSEDLLARSACHCGSLPARWLRRVRGLAPQAFHCQPLHESLFLSIPHPAVRPQAELVENGVRTGAGVSAIRDPTRLVVGFAERFDGHLPVVLGVGDDIGFLPFEGGLLPGIGVLWSFILVVNGFFEWR